MTPNPHREAGAQFTPGPWFVRSAAAGVFNVSAAKKTICNTPNCDPRGALALNEANAHLIAAAPELYEALAEQVAACFDPTCQMCIRHERILAKARR